MNQYPMTEKTAAHKAFMQHYGMTEEQARNTALIPCEVRQLRSAQAWIITDSHGNKWLQSYSTLVSVFWADTQKIERLGKWSTTTSKHQTWFEWEVL